MNVFESIQKIVERETGLICVYEQQNISDNQIMISIREIEKTGNHGQYQVFGNFLIKTGVNTGWKVLTQILDLHLTGIRAGATLSEVSHGFALMSVEFSIVLQAEQEREHCIKTLEYVQAIS